MGVGLGAALQDWAADVAERNHHVALIRADGWTTNSRLHAYFERQRFTRLAGTDPLEPAGYPSQAFFERKKEWSGSGYKKLFTDNKLAHALWVPLHWRSMDAPSIIR